jgi:hypothetical protein
MHFIIACMTMSFRVIFEQDHLMDGGTFQFYGQAQEVVVDSMVGERMAGFVAWGQWRGWYEPPCGTMGRSPCPPPPEVQVGDDGKNGRAWLGVSTAALLCCHDCVARNLPHNMIRGDALGR